MGRESRETVKLWHSPALPGIDLLRARYVSQRFNRHSHPQFAIGMIEGGALGFRYRGAEVVAPAGTVNLANAGEAHTGRGAAESGWAYRMFYFDPRVLRSAARQLADRPRAVPFFQEGVIRDPDLAGAIGRLHWMLETGGSAALQAQDAFLQMLTLLVTRHADPPVTPRAVGREPAAVGRVKALMAVDPAADLTVNQLAAVAGLSPYHFIRVFRKAEGLTPHAYLMQLRAETAKTLLARGRSIVDAALGAGFADQSHLSRHFKRIYGITPGTYRNFVQDRRPKAFYTSP